MAAAAAREQAAAMAGAGAGANEVDTSDHLCGRWREFVHLCASAMTDKHGRRHRVHDQMLVEYVKPRRLQDQINSLGVKQCEEILGSNFHSAACKDELSIAVWIFRHSKIRILRV